MSGMRTVLASAIACPGFGQVGDETYSEDAFLALRSGTARRRDDLMTELHPAPICVKTARDRTADILAAWGLEGCVADATLVVSELVTNALHHAAPADPSVEWAILLRLVRRGRHAMCLVADPSDRPPILTEADFAAETGRGLHLVTAYTRRWDWALRRQRPGKWVWALLLPPRQAPR
jgi:anti-sigma regulatory factor (Ser/Thr protein kinase)